jgi:phospholipid-binding lipoprotein MlaA
MRVMPALILSLLLSACATTGNRASLEPRDPYEGFNRGMWAFNDAVETVAVKPATTAYRTVTPTPLRRGITRVFANLTEPFSVINGLLQGKPKRALNSLGRFLINSTIGVGGLADHATDLGLPPTREDFGQTLAQWGAKNSPYLVLPLLGPSTVRDGVGTVVQLAADPGQLILTEGASLTASERLGVTGLRLIDQRAQQVESGYDIVLETSADPYAAARSAYFQRREAQLNDNDNAVFISKPESEQEALDKALDEETPPPAVQPQEPQTPEGTAQLDAETSELALTDQQVATN